MEKNLLSILEKIRALALEGKHYAKDPYDKERYEKLLQMATDEFSEVLQLPSAEEIVEYKDTVGCITPKVGVDILISNHEGKVLILKRSSKKQDWCLPGGWMDLGESPQQTACREAKEEVGLDVEFKEYLTIMNKGPDIYQGFPYQVNILASTKPFTEDVFVQLSHEHLEYRWIGEDDTVENWHSGHEKYFPLIFEYLKNGKKSVTRSH